MVRVVGVRFRPAGKVYTFEAGAEQWRAGEAVIVETSRGLEYGRVAIPPRWMDPAQVPQPLRPVLRRATAEDEARVEENRALQSRAFRQAAAAVARHRVPMKLVDAEYTFDRSRLTFHFVAEERVDFRALVRELAGMFHTRIELRQIGVRDAAKLWGGIGPCGRVLCCSTFLAEFAPIPVRLVKGQEAPGTPGRMTGMCGRLMCCVPYELPEPGPVLPQADSDRLE